MSDLQPLPPPEIDSGSFKLPKKLSHQMLVLIVALLVPTGAAGGVGLSLRGVNEKLDLLVSAQVRLENRFERLEGAGIEARVHDLDERQRRTEEGIAELRAVVGAKGK